MNTEKNRRDNRQQSNRQWYQILAAEAQKIVLPARPVFDKIVAAYLICWLQRRTNGLNAGGIEIEFREDQHPTPQTWERWRNELAYVLDVGTEKYQLKEKGSATQVLADREEAITAHPIMQRLVEITVENNETGYLKQYKHSVVWILREMYKLDKYSKREIVEHVGRMIHRRIKAQEIINDDRCGDRTEETFRACAELRDLIEEIGTGFEPFTLSRYALDLWIYGYSANKIREEVAYFLEAEQLGKEKAENCGSEFYACEHREFGWKRAVCVRTNDDNIGRWVLNNLPYDIVMIRRDKSDPRNRNVVVLTRGGKEKINLAPLADLLVWLEGHAQKDQVAGRWYYDERINALLNGTVGHGVPATFLTDACLIRLLEHFLFEFRRKSDDELMKLAKEIANTQPESRKVDLGKVVEFLRQAKPRRQEGRREHRSSDRKVANGN